MGVKTITTSWLSFFWFFMEGFAMANVAKKVSKKVAKVGRPKKFTSEQVRLFKSVVREFGLTGAIPVLLEKGLSVSVPTLSKYISTGAGGRPPVRLKRGRPRKVETNQQVVTSVEEVKVEATVEAVA
jgi:hypothetical protein